MLFYSFKNRKKVYINSKQLIFICIYNEMNSQDDEFYVDEVFKAVIFGPITVRGAESAPSAITILNV